jgi:tRNA (guanine37-N1)-methyltransferase
MRYDILTIFPEQCKTVLETSIIGRAVKNGIITINTVDIRAFSEDKHKKVDDYPYGGGSGMIMMAQPIYDAYLSLIEGLDYKPHVIYMSPAGKLLTHKEVLRFSKYDHIIILCGHYEGVDERVLEEIVDEEVSIGDYIVTGGELPAMVFIDAISRTIPGVLSCEEAYTDESISTGLLEYPQYTRPYDFMGKMVPEILISGHHANISEWRRRKSIEKTVKKRPDLLSGHS